MPDLNLAFRQQRMKEGAPLSSDGCDRVPLYPRQWRKSVLAIDWPEIHVPTEIVETRLMPQHSDLRIFSEPCLKPPKWQEELKALVLLRPSIWVRKWKDWAGKDVVLLQREQAGTKHTPIPRERKASLFLPLLCSKEPHFTDVPRLIASVASWAQPFSGPVCITVLD